VNTAGQAGFRRGGRLFLIVVVRLTGFAPVSGLRAGHGGIADDVDHDRWPSVAAATALR
jgi:hypothetical protein